MTLAVCPYCRCPVEDAEREQLVCARCGTPHHSDCYAENGGCTVFGCTAAPEDEPKLSVSGVDLIAPDSASGAHSTAVAGRAAPPPMANGAAIATPAAAPNYNAGSVLFRPVPLVPSAPAVVPAYIDLPPDPNAKNRSTFIMLGALLGMVGAHNFYAGYRTKAFVQLAITVLTFGFAGLMSWVWAVIDICTVDADSEGVKFKS